MTDRITVTITSEDDRSSETVDVTFARRLRHLADHLENPAFANSYGDNIVDQDGEKVGEWQITPADGAGEEVTPEADTSTTWMDDDAYLAEQTHRLAKEFARLMTEALHPTVFSLVNALNAGRKYDPASCASHEFIDANEVMLEALGNLGIEFAPENEENATLTNEAWQIAKVMNFTL